MFGLGGKKKKSQDLVTMDEVPLDGKAVLVRVDFNVAVGENNKVDEDEDYRIEMAMSTIEELQRRRCKVILMTHLGRPSAGEGDFSLGPIHRRLEDLIKEDVRLIDQLTGDTVKAAIDGMEKGSVAMLPNLRADERETAGSDKLAGELADLGDAYVNEAFSVSHRDHTSMSKVPRLMTACAGRRTVEEYEVLSKLKKEPERPYVAIVSGAKVHTKVNLLRKLVKQVDSLCVGGVLANMFLANQGKAPRESFTYEDMQVAKELWEEAGDKIVVPRDLVIGSLDGSATGREVVSVDTALSSAVGVWDVGPVTVKEFLDISRQAKTIMWNGPIGMFEVPAYSEGTRSLAFGLAELESFKVVGGGETVHVLEMYKLRKKFDHVSVGGGAMVAFLEGSPMPGLTPIRKKEESNA